MLEVEESQLDEITALFYHLLRGEKISPIQLPPGAPENEYTQLVLYVNRFIQEYHELAEFMYALSRGELEYTPPGGKMRVLQSFKSLQASLRHLTWKTQKIAAGDFSQRVDFMGDFSAAFNSMTQQLEQAFVDLEHANRELTNKNQQITDSILYAQRIQQAILPAPEVMHQAFAGQFFVIYSPKNIVSGDFYWLACVRDEILAAVVDCTGHGVAGAFLSMIGHTLLNKIVIENQILEPAQILEQLHIGVRAALQQESGEAQDGMEVGLCRLHADRRQITFAGAKRPLYIVSQQQLQEVKGDRESIGGRQKETCRTFTSQHLMLLPGDMFYLSSDGLPDQPNPHGKKFGSRQLKTLLSEAASQPVLEQERLIRACFLAHQQNEPQRDDIVLLGVRV